MKLKLKPILTAAAIAALSAVAFPSCKTDDDLRPCPYDKFYAEALQGSEAELYEAAYATLRTTDTHIHHTPTTQAGCNIRGTDGTMSDFVRSLFNIEELASDEAICAWDDSGVYRYMTSQPQRVSPSTAGFFLRALSGIRIADTYINKYGRHNVRTGEIRAIRALLHLYILDIFGDCGAAIGLPEGMSAANYIERETLKALDLLREPRRVTESDPDYGLMNRGVARAILMRLYLNSEVYTGQKRYAEALQTAQQIIDCGVYNLSTRPSVILAGDTLLSWTGYQKLFMADNGRNGAQVEAILPLRFDKDTIATYHATSFLTGSTFDDKMYLVSPTDTLGQTNGTTLTWAGNRCRPELISRFSAGPVDNADTRTFQKAVGDDRALFFSKGRNMEVTDYRVFTDGYATTKFNALFAEGSGPAMTGFFSSSDFFLIRLAEVYLTAAEAAWRLKDRTAAASYINILRQRAHATPVSPASINDQFILDEWSREFYFEGRRRTDMIRFGEYYGRNARRWSWKGGVRRGCDLPASLCNFIAPDTATVGARALELYRHDEYKKPADIYYVAGSGVVENQWDIKGGDNFGIGLIPFAKTDSDIVYIDYFTTQMHFKLVGKIGTWEEQFGSGDYGTFLHNELNSEPICVPCDGVYRVRIDKREAKVTVLRYFGPSTVRQRVNLALPNGGVIHFRRCNRANINGHSWMADLDSDDQGRVTPFRIMADGTPVGKLDLTYGLDAYYDEDGNISLPPVLPGSRIRIIFNDIMRSCYFYVITPDSENADDGDF